MITRSPIAFEDFLGSSIATLPGDDNNEFTAFCHVCKNHVCCVNPPYQVKEAAKVLGVGAPVLQADPFLMQKNRRQILERRFQRL